MVSTPLPRRIVRVLSWHRRGLAALLAVVAVLVAFRALGSDGPPTTAVVVTTRPITAGHRLTSGDLEVRAVPVDGVPTGALTDPDALIGRLAAAALPSRQVLTPLAAVSERQAGPGRVVAPLRLADAALAGLLRPGESIGVVAADPDTGRSSIVATDVRVVTVPETSVATGPLGSTTSADGVLCLVSVPTDQAATLAGAAAGQLSVIWSGG